MSVYQVRKTPGDTEWFRHDRFGMFIHWGLYALPARHEWVKNHERTPEEVYDRYFRHFDPDLFDAREWARQAKAAGMKYAVLTTKHHEGFCLFDSQYTDYKATNTPAGRDLVREFVDAFRAEGLKIGFYYSLIDWHHPDFTIDPNHPRRDDPDAEQQNAGRDMKRYAQYMRDQVTELLTGYGKIDILWFDFSYPDMTMPGKPWMKGKGKDDWEADKLIALARSLQPGIMIDNRAGIDQDLWTPEQYQPQTWLTDEDGQLVLSLNAKNDPDLKVSPAYEQMLEAYDAQQKSEAVPDFKQESAKHRKTREAAQFVVQKIDSARWFMEMIRQRKATMMRIMQAIVDYQHDYFLDGDVARLRPMRLKDIAEKVGMDISTVSRVINNKYIQTHFGTYLVKEFFSQSTEKEDGEAISTSQVKAA